MKLKVSFLFCLFCLAGAFAQNYPNISELKSSNPVYLQYQDEVASSNKKIALEEKVSLNLYSYTANKNDSVLRIAARCSIPYETLATVNSIPENTTELEGKELVLPTSPGLFIPLEPSNAIEILLAKEHSLELLSGSVPKYSINGRSFYFLQNKRFSPTERSFYLDSSFRLPLDTKVLTSSYGMRVSPISGTWKFHSGIDMAAEIGTSVFACKSGTVQFTGFNSTYGNYIILSHNGGTTSVYAHLSKILVKKGEVVSAGTTIGRVGVTGASTGPHLHFEIREGGVAQNPESYLN